MIDWASIVSERIDVNRSPDYEGICPEITISQIMTKFGIFYYEQTRSQHTKGGASWFPTVRTLYGNLSYPFGRDEEFFKWTHLQPKRLIRPKRVIHQTTRLSTGMIFLGSDRPLIGLHPILPQTPVLGPAMYFQCEWFESALAGRVKRLLQTGPKRLISASHVRLYRPKCQNSSKTPLIYPLIPQMGRQCISYGNRPIIKGIANTSISSERLGRL